MYRTCIFCSADLGGNDSIEEFPVGSRLAFDAWKGRLWAVCPKCTRWNLAPIEERWEAVESAEKCFRDARLRVHSENIGLSKLPDGTRLIRVGEALPRELAAWRYGDRLVRRRRNRWLGAGATGVGAGALLLGGIPLLAAASVPVAAVGWGLQIAGNWMLVRNEFRPVLRLPEQQSPTGRELVIRQASSRLLRVVPGSTESGIAVELPSPLPMRREEEGGVVRWVPPPPLRFEGDSAHRLLERSLVSANAWGTGTRQLDAALRCLDTAGDPHRFLAEVAQRDAGIFPAWLSQNTNAGGVPDVRGAFRRFIGTFRNERIHGAPHPAPRRSLPRHEALALEMALHQESERRALEGELAALEAAWREAEEIAAIADTLPDDPLDRLKR